MAISERPYQPSNSSFTPQNQTALNVPAALAGPLPALQVLTTTTETVVTNPTNPTIALIAQIPPDKWPMEQTLFDLYASGYIKTTAAGTVTLKLYSGSSTTVGSDTLLGTSGAITQNTTTAAFMVHARLIYNSISGALEGMVEFYVNRTKVAEVTLSNFPTGIANTNNPVAQFVLSLTASAVGTGVTINVQRFSVG